MADTRTWLEKVRVGDPFEMLDWDFIGQVEALRPKLRRFNAEPDFFARQKMLPDFLGKVGKDVVILPDLTVDVGINVEIGDRSFINANGTLLDTFPIRIGNDVQIGPNCGLYPVGHPLQSRMRNYYDSTGERRSVTTGAAIIIEDDVWLGGNVLVMPGVTIGARSVIGAGSVVTKSIPPDVFAAGNPCRVIKPIDNGGA